VLQKVFFAISLGSTNLDGVTAIAQHFLTAAKIDFESIELFRNKIVFRNK
jgi:hypothetical protein